MVKKETIRKIVGKIVDTRKANQKKLSKTATKGLSKKIKYKRILKKQQPTLTIHQKEIPSVLGDYNRFFKSEMQKEFEL